MHDSRARLCFVGPMLGRHPNYVTTQGEILGRHFGECGYPVIETSSSLNRYVRFLDIATTIVRRRNDIDVLVVNLYGGPSFAVEDVASWLGRRSGHRVVFILRGGAIPSFMTRHPRWVRRVLARAHAIITPSAYLARAVATQGFKARVIPNVIDLTLYPWRRREEVQPKLFWMRTFEDAWNPFMPLRVLAKLRRRLSAASLTMAGQDNGLEAETKRLAQDLGVSTAVRFPGFLDMQRKIEESDRADIFLNTNRIDNMPVSVVEACAFGLPVVSTNVGGIADLLTHDETGLLVPDDDEERMVDEIFRLLDDRALVARLSANGRRLAERSSWEAVRPQWEGLFSELRN
jgi:glycosyltransferase involved in cell wall biosynthesis